MEVSMNIQKGIYLVIDPAMEQDELLKKLEAVLKEDISIVQILDNFQKINNIGILIKVIIEVCHQYSTPILINNKTDLLEQYDFDGIHLDKKTNELEKLRQNGASIIGLTCNNDLDDIRWAKDRGIDYISFCSMFSSETSNSCELVDFKTVQEARKITEMPIFLSGGIAPEKMKEIAALPYDGIAVVSGIMSADMPEEAVREYKEKLEKYETGND